MYLFRNKKNERIHFQHKNEKQIRRMACKYIRYRFLYIILYTTNNNKKNKHYIIKYVVGVDFLYRKRSVVFCILILQRN